MSILSKSTGYSILALGCLAQAHPSMLFVKEIASRTGVPRPYLAKLLQNLSAAGLVEAKRGYRGGWALSSPAEEISLFDIAVAVDGMGWMSKCLLGMVECSEERRCPLHGFWKMERERIEAMMRGVNLVEVVEFEKSVGLRTFQAGDWGFKGLSLED